MSEIISSQSSASSSFWRVTRYREAWRIGLLAPVALFLVALLLWPLVEIVQGAIAGGSSSFQTLQLNTTLLRVLENTIVVSVITTLISTTLAYGIAFAAWRSGPTMRIVIFAFVLLPFWTDILVKTFALIELLRSHGVINDLLIAWGIIDQPLHLLHTRTAVIIGMVHYTLPYAVFPIFAVMLPLDKRLDQAAESLGAGRWGRMWHVLLPLTLSGILASAMLAFIISVGFFIAPVLLGGPGDLMISNTIEYYQTQLVDFNTAAMVAVGVSLAVTVLIVAYQRIPTEGQHGAN